MTKGIVVVACMALMMVASSVSAQEPQDQTVHKAGKDVTSPRLIKEVKPRYTRDAMDRKIAGVVTLACVVETDGTPSNIQVTKSLDQDLDQTAIEALEQWRFTPGTKDGKAVRVAIDVEMTFTLKR